MTVMTVQAPSMSNDPISGGFHLLIWRGGVFGETCLSSALARAEELKIPYLVNTGSSRDGAALRERNCLGAGDYIQGLKLDLARQLLKSTDLPISEISLRCGFAKQDVPSRAIKLKDGLSQREFRQSHRHAVRQKNQA